MELSFEIESHHKMSSAENLFPDLHHKMSKKIAQLTKVIYHLNTKNEEHTDDLSALSDAYETEIDGILKDAYTKVNKFKEKLEERKSVEQQQQAVDEFKKQHEREKAEALAALEEYKKQAKEQEKKTVKEFEKRLNNAAEAYEQTRLDFKKRIEEFNATVKKLEAEGGIEVEKVRRKHEKELADHVQQNNFKYNEMLRQRLDAEEKLQQQLEGALAKARKEAEAEVNKKVKQALAEAEKERKEELEKLRRKHDQQLSAAEESARKAAKTLQEQVEGWKRKAEDAAASCRLLEGEQDQATRKLKEMQEGWEKEKKGLVLEKEEAKKKAEGASTQLKAEAGRLAVLEEKVAQMKAELARTSDHSQGARAAMEEELRALRERAERAEQEAEAERSKGADALQKAMLLKDQQTQELRARVSALEEEVKQLEAAAAAKEKEAQRLLSDRDRDASKMVEEKEKELRREVAEKAKEAAALAAALKQTHADNTAALAKAGRERERVEGELEQRTRQLKHCQEKLSAAEKGAKDRDQAALARVKELEREVAGGEARRKELERSLHTAESKLSSAETAAAALHQRLAELEARLHEAQGDLGARLTQAENDLQNARQEAQEEKKRLEEAKEAAQRAAREREEGLKQELFEATAEKDRLKARLTTMEQELADSTVNASKECARLKEELDTMIKKKLDLEKDLAKEKAKKAEELRDKVAALSEQQHALELRLQEAQGLLERERKGRERDKKEAEDRLAAEVARRGEELKLQMMQEGSAQTSAALAELQAEQREQREAELHRLKAEHAAELHRLGEEREEEGKRRREEVAALKEHARKELEGERERREAEHRDALAKAEEEGRTRVKEAEEREEKERRRGEEEREREREEAEERARREQASAQQRLLAQTDAALRARDLAVQEERTTLLADRARREKELGEEHAAAMRHKDAELAAAQAQMTRLGASVERLEAEGCALRQRLEAQDAEARRELEEVRRAAEEERRRVEEERKRTIEDMMTEHLEETKNLQEEWMAAMAAVNAKCDQLSKELAEMTGRWEARESREEDLLKIASLEDTIVQWANKVKKLEEECKQAKLELVNREENFNSKFAGQGSKSAVGAAQGFGSMGGGAMNVGVMDPLAFKKQNSTKLPNLGSSGRNLREAKNSR